MLFVNVLVSRVTSLYGERTQTGKGTNSDGEMGKGDWGNGDVGNGELGDGESGPFPWMAVG